MSSLLRFKGFALIVNTLLPFALILLLIVLGYRLTDTAGQALAPPYKQLQEDLTAIADHGRQTKERVQEAVTAVQAEAIVARAALSDALAPLTAFKIDLPEISLPIPTGITCSPITLSRLHAPDPVRTADLGRDLIEGPARIIGDIIKPPVIAPPNPGVVPLPRPGPPILQDPAKGVLTPICRLETLNIRPLAGVQRAINAGLAAAFKGPREHFAEIDAALTATVAEVTDVTALLRDFPVMPADLAARQALWIEAQRSFIAGASDTLRTALWVAAAVLLWIVLSCGLWIADRLMLGWHLLRFARYP